MLFAAFGAELVDAKGNVTLHTPDEVRQVMEYGQQLVKFLPSDVMSYDSASNNRALISGQSALIFNPPSAWAVAKRDAPQVARDCWTFSAPRGPKGRFVAYNPYFWSIWSFSQQQDRGEGTAGISLPARAGRGTYHARWQGFDMPPFDSMLDFTDLEEVEPPRGTVYPLSDPSVAPRAPARRRHAGATRHRHADLQSRHHAGNVRTSCSPAVHPNSRSPGRRKNWPASCADGRQAMITAIEITSRAPVRRWRRIRRQWCL